MAITWDKISPSITPHMGTWSSSAVTPLGYIAYGQPAALFNGGHTNLGDVTPLGSWGYELSIASSLSTSPPGTPTFMALWLGGYAEADITGAWTYLASPFAGSVDRCALALKSRVPFAVGLDRIPWFAPIPQCSIYNPGVSLWNTPFDPFSGATSSRAIATAYHAGTDSNIVATVGAMANIEVAITYDGGLTFSRSTVPFDPLWYTWDIRVAAVAAGWVMVIGNGSTAKVLTSPPNGGGTWTDVTVAVGIRQFWPAASATGVIGTPLGAFISTEDGDLFHSTDLISWTDVAVAAGLDPVRGYAVIETSTGVYVGPASYGDTRPGRTWAFGTFGAPPGPTVRWTNYRGVMEL